MEQHLRKNGFSLVELSIVLVILGLLTGGILAGQSLIKASELRTVTQQAAEFSTALNTFRNKYFAIPGDMSGAGRFWGYVNTSGTNGNCTTPAADSGTGTETCDGNGDGLVNIAEWHRFWQHLSNAGLIQGTYTGVGGPGGFWNQIAGVNAPPSKYGSGAWWSLTWVNFTGDAAMFAGEYNNSLVVAGLEATGTNYAGPLFNAEDAWNIDNKLDDGKPGTGKVKVYLWNSDCTDAGGNTLADAEAAAYVLSNPVPACGLMFTNAY